MTGTRLKGITFDPVIVLSLHLVSSDHADGNVWYLKHTYLISLQYNIPITLEKTLFVSTQ